MGAIFNAPMRADGVGCDSCRERLGGDVIGGLVGLRFPQTGFRAAVYPLTGHPDHAVQQVLPGGIEDLGPEGEDLDRAEFLTTAMAIAGLDAIVWRLFKTERANRPEQAGLVALDLSDQHGSGITGVLERFFWQGIASAVTSLCATPMSASKR